MKAVVRVISVILLAAAILAFGCAKPAPVPPPPSPTSVPKPPPTSAPPPAAKPPAPAPVSKADPLAQVIEGAKKEGAVSVSLVASYTPAPLVQQLRNNIKEKYGIDLDIKVVASSNQAADLAKAIMEFKTGAAPSYDVVTLGSDLIPGGLKEGVFEKVDWKPLFPPGTDPDIVPQSPQLNSGPVLYSSGAGLMYNPKKVPADQVPKTLNDLANPKWKGRLGVMNYGAYWARWAFVLGKEKTLATLRGMLKNQPSLGEMGALNNKYLLGEIDVVFLTTTYLLNNETKGVPSAFRALDFLEMRDYQLSVVKNAKHPNAAKLLAVYLSSADGVKFSTEKVQKGNHHYPGNYEYDIMAQAKKDGVPVYTLANNAKLLDFILSPEYNGLQKEIELIIKGG